MVFEHVTHDAVNRAAVTLDGAAGKAVNVAKVLRALGGRGRRGQRVEPDGRGEVRLEDAQRLAMAT
jgi:hypothetical protein